MEVRFLNEGDYDVLSSWWKDWRWTPPPRDFLPQDGTGGLMVSKDGIDICAGFIYFTNSKTAIIEFIVSNFQYKNKDRKEAIEFLINTLTEVAKETNGCKYIYTSLKNQNLLNSFSACDYHEGSTGCIEMIKIL
jgi:hypothetical protein